MKDYTGKYIEIYDKAAKSTLCILVKEQTSYELDGEFDVSGVGFAYGPDCFAAATTTRGAMIDGKYNVKEISRIEFLDRHTKAWRQFRAKLTKKTYNDSKSIKL